MVRAMTAEATVSLVRCGVGGMSFGLDMASVSGLERADRLRPETGGEGLVGRLPRVDGDVPVFELAQLLGRPPGPGTQTRHIAVVSGPVGLTGLLVDRVSQVMRVPARALLPLPAQAVDPRHSYYQGVILSDDSLLPVLDPMRLLTPGNGRAADTRLDASSLPAPDGHADPQLVLFQLTGSAAAARPIVFGLSLRQVVEVVGGLPVQALPGARAHVLGLAAWRDRPLPVFDLGARLGLPGAAPDHCPRLLVARMDARGMAVGVPVRPGVRVLRLPVAHLPCDRSLPLDPGIVRGAFELKNETVVVPDLGQMIGGSKGSA